MALRPKKSLGQHFLTDQNIIQKIAKAIRGEATDRIIEIGAGTGRLTKAILKRFEDVHAIEIDRRAVRILKKNYPTLAVHHQNIQETAWNELSVGKQRTHVVGNLPYYMVSQILFLLLKNRQFLADALLMMQKEVAERLTAQIRTKAYGILSVQTQLMSSPEILFPVARGCFKPPPNVESAMVLLKFDKGELRCSDANLKTVIRTAFNQRRKKLSNSLKPLVKKKNQPEGFDYDKRAEAWPPQIYEKLTVRLVSDGILT